MLQQNKHKLSQPLCSTPCTSRHERKRGSAVTAAGKASEQHALLHGCSQASSSASKLILSQNANMPKHAKTCCRNVHACQCTKLSRFVKNSVHAKVSSKKYATDCPGSRSRSNLGVKLLRQIPNLSALRGCWGAHEMVGVAGRSDLASRLQPRRSVWLLASIGLRWP